MFSVRRGLRGRRELARNPCTDNTTYSRDWSLLILTTDCMNADKQPMERILMRSSRLKQLWINTSGRVGLIENKASHLISLLVRPVRLVSGPLYSHLMRWFRTTCLGCKHVHNWISNFANFKVKFAVESGKTRIMNTVGCKSAYMDTVTIV